MRTYLLVATEAEIRDLEEDLDAAQDDKDAMAEEVERWRKAQTS